MTVEYCPYCNQGYNSTPGHIRPTLQVHMQVERRDLSRAEVASGKYMGPIAL